MLYLAIAGILILVGLTSALYLRIRHPFWWNQPVVHRWDVYRRWIYPQLFPDRRVASMFQHAASFPVPRAGAAHRRLTTRPIRSFHELLFSESQRFSPPVKDKHNTDSEDDSHLLSVLAFLYTHFTQSKEDTFFIGDHNFLAHRLNDDDGHATICTSAHDRSTILGVVVSCAAHMRHYTAQVHSHLYMVELEVVAGGDLESETARDVFASHLRNQVLRRSHHSRAPVTLFRRRMEDNGTSPSDLAIVPLTVWPTLTIRLFQSVVAPRSNKVSDFVAPVQLRRVTDDPLFWAEIESVLAAHFDVTVLSHFSRTEQKNRNQSHFFVFALESIRTHHSPQTLLGLYFFHEPQFQFAKADYGLAVHCTASICLTSDRALFQLGFKVALRNIVGFIKNVRALILDGAAHNVFLPPVDQLGDVIHSHRTALYAHNAVLVPVDPTRFFSM